VRNGRLKQQRTTKSEDVYENLVMVYQCVTHRETLMIELVLVLRSRFISNDIDFIVVTK